MSHANNHESELGAYLSQSRLEMTIALLENPAKHTLIPDPETPGDNKCILF